MLRSAARFLFLNYETPLGSAALATATFAALKARLPQAHLTVAASGITANTFRASPLIDELIVTPHAIGDTLKAVGFFLRHVWPRRDQFDYVVTDSGNERTHVALLALASGVRRRVGMSLRPALFHTGLRYDHELSNIDNSMRVLQAMGLNGPTVEPAVHFLPADLAKVQTLLAETPDPLPAPRIALVTQVSGAHPNQWFDDRWTELSGRLADKLRAGLVFVGTGADTTAIDKLRAGLSVPSLSAAGRTDIPQLAALLASCDLVITIDTGTLHIARAVGVPSVVVGHAATPKHTWLPLGDPIYRILLHDVPCAGCKLHFCATRECMQENTVDLVEAAAMHQLKAYPPSLTARAARLSRGTSGKAPILS